jgi:hypothetical protein
LSKFRIWFATPNTEIASSKIVKKGTEQMTDATRLCIRCGKPEPNWNFWPHCEDCWQDVADECHRAWAEMEEAEARPGSRRP